MGKNEKRTRLKLDNLSLNKKVEKIPRKESKKVNGNLIRIDEYYYQKMFELGNIYYLSMGVFKGVNYTKFIVLICEFFKEINIDENEYEQIPEDILKHIKRLGKRRNYTFPNEIGKKRVFFLDLKEEDYKLLYSILYSYFKRKEQLKHLDIYSLKYLITYVLNWIEKDTNWVLFKDWVEDKNNEE